MIALGHAPHARTFVLSLDYHFLGRRLVRCRCAWRRRVGRGAVNLDGLNREGSAECCNDGARRDGALCHDVKRSAPQACP